MVASRYPNRPAPLWNLPGGRQLPSELLAETVVREVFEETGLCVEPQSIAYVSESYDGDVHFVNVTFAVALVGSNPSLPSTSLGADSDFAVSESDHVARVEWVPLEEVGARIVVAVVREPLLAHLRGSLPARYAGYHEAGITIEWPDDSR